jgi:hypothetical protein
LDGLRRFDFGPEDADPLLSDFHFETVIDPKLQNQLDRALRILPASLIEIPDEDILLGKLSTNFVLKYRILFEPLKILNTSIELIISSKDRGRWRVIIELVATEPEPDDHIKLTAAVGSSDAISFKLANRFLGFSEFQAYFSFKSSSHFTVSPTSGVLAPFGMDGTPFVITFTPLVYGNRET